jgi:hypothetical protein
LTGFQLGVRSDELWYWDYSEETWLVYTDTGESTSNSFVGERTGYVPYNPGWWDEDDYFVVHSTLNLSW